jgi:hypothetical protein
MRALVIVILVAALLGCTKPGQPIEDASAEAGTFGVQFIFEVDGVRVYRFEDGGHNRYFATGGGTYLPQLQQVSDGKGTTTTWDDGASTVRGKP